MILISVCNSVINACSCFVIRTLNMSGDMMFPPLYMTSLLDNCEENERHSGRNREEPDRKKRISSMKHQKEGENTDVYDDLLATIKAKDLEIERLRRLNKIYLQHRKEADNGHTKSEKDLQIERLRKTNRSLAQQRQETERRSRQITSEMARVTAASGTFENINEELSNSRVIERFQKLYSNDWVNLSRWLMKTFPGLSELQIIKCLSKLMKYCYNECQIMADSQMRHFLMLDMKETIPENKQHPDLFQLRRQYAQSETSRKKIVQVVLQRLLLADILDIFLNGGKRNDSIEKLKHFFKDYIDCCWLMVVSNPAIKLNFGTVGDAYRNCMEQFTKYSLKIPVEDRTKSEDSVYEVVWPSVCLHDDSSHYQKGDVIVVTKGKGQDHNNCDCCTFDVYKDKSTIRFSCEGSSVAEGKVSNSRSVRKQKLPKVSDV